MEINRIYNLPCTVCGFKGLRYMGPWLKIYEGIEDDLSEKDKEHFGSQHQFECMSSECGTTCSYDIKDIPDDIEEIEINRPGRDG